MPNLILGTSKDDVLKGKHGEDLIYGLAGNDTIDGNAGNDVISGGGRDLAMIANGRFAIENDWAGSVTFMGETAGHQNTIGMYEIAADGSVSNVRVLFANGSEKGSGGSLIAGQSAAATNFKAGVKYGFFIVPNGYGTSAAALDKAGTYALKTVSGATANVNTAGPLVLWHVDASGKETKIVGAYDGASFHALGAAGQGTGLNGDGIDHAKVVVDPATGTLTISFEDLKGGGDRDFDDAIVRLDIGIDNALALADANSAGNGGDDRIAAGEGDDTVFGMTGNDTLSGGSGNDRLWGNTGNDTVSGDDGDDRATGGEGNDTVLGGAGNDKLWGNTGADKVQGDGGADSIAGNDGDDTLSGGEGNDSVAGGKGVDTISGDAGDDKLYGDTGIDTISGGDGNDAIKGGDGDDTISGDAGDDAINGGKGIDKISDGAGNDKVDADSGDDWIVVGAGNDTYIGGSGIDTLDFSSFTGVEVNLLKHFANGADYKKISGIENVVGSADHDNLTGDSLANIISGGDGNDRITGGRGSDVFTGGLGSDTFVWASGKDAYGERGTDKFVDVITDFGYGDILDLLGVPENDPDQPLSELVALREEGSNTVVSAAFSGGIFVDVVVLMGVTGLSIHGLWGDGALNV